jgi:hypothetical protein
MQIDVVFIEVDIYVATGDGAQVSWACLRRYMYRYGGKRQGRIVREERDQPFK